MLSLPAPAKINWFLHITGKRADGYHDLQTYFQFLDWSDLLHFEKLTSNECIIEGMDDVPLKSNLIYKAFKALTPYLKGEGLKVVIDKKLPYGGGLGGGSSNAATTLLAINQLWQLGLTNPQLMEIGCHLGADVPVFIYRRACFAQGIGEKCHALEMKESWIVLLIPDCQVSTQKLFQHPELTTNTLPCKIEALEEMEATQLKEKGFKNAFEPLVRKLYTPVASAMDWLDTYSKASLSGSGCCAFAPFANEQEARTTVNMLPSTMRGIVVKTLNHAPLWTVTDK